MPKQSKSQRSTVKRVMHEFKHGELERGQGGKVKSRKQAVAIALHEAGASKYESAAKNRANLRETKANERRTRGGPRKATSGRRATTRQSSN